MMKFLTISLSTLYFLFITNITLFGSTGGINTDSIKSRFPLLLSNNNAGTEFMLSVPPAFDGDNSDKQIKLLITSPYKTNVTVSVKSKNYNETKVTIPDEMILFTLSPQIAIPMQKIFTAKPLKDTVMKDAGIHVVSDMPIIIYVFVMMGDYQESYLALPVVSLGKQYIVASYNSPHKNEPNYSFSSSTACIVGAYDNTQVRFNVGSVTGTKIAGIGTLPGNFFTKMLDKGDVLQVMSEGQYSDLSGSFIEANKPIAVINGNYSTTVPITDKAQNYLVEMAFPLYSNGYKYITGILQDRIYPAYLRAFTATENTMVYINGKNSEYLKPYGFLTPIYEFLNHKIQTVDTFQNPVVYHSNSPINVVYYGPSGGYEPSDVFYYKPFMVNAVPVEQFQNEITLMIPQDDDGSAFYNFNQIQLWYEKTEVSDPSNHLEWGEKINGEFVWRKLNDVFPYKEFIIGKKGDLNIYAYRQIILNGKTGLFKVRNSLPLSASIYGYSTFTTHSLPASTNFNLIGHQDSDKPEPKFTQCCDGITGTVTDYPDDDYFRTNLKKITFIPEPYSYNIDFSYTDFIPGITRTTTWEGKTIDKYKKAKLTVNFIDFAGNDTTITFDFEEYYKFNFSPDTLDFGKVETGKKLKLKIILSNLSKYSSATLDKLNITGVEPDFALINIPNLPFIMKENSSVDFEVEFTPSAIGKRKIYITALMNNGHTIVDSIYAEAVSPVDVNDFSNNAGLNAPIPNPLINSADISFSIANPGMMKLSVINSITGDETILMNEFKNAGRHNFIIDNNMLKLNSGAYLLQLETDGTKFTRNFVIIN